MTTRIPVHPCTFAVGDAGPTDASACDGTGVRGGHYWTGGGKGALVGATFSLLALWGCQYVEPENGQWRVVDEEGAGMCLTRAWGEEGEHCVLGAGCDEISGGRSSASTRAVSAVAGEITQAIASPHGYSWVSVLGNVHLEVKLVCR